MSQVNQDRRSFLSGKLLTQQGRQAHYRNQSRQGPYPPGLKRAIDEGNCLDCIQPCIVACERGIIRRHSELHPLHPQPYLSFDAYGCNYCLDCSKACPEITYADETINSSKIGTIDLDKKTCHAWNGIFCMSCIGSCEEEAIFLDSIRRVETVKDRCKGCGECVVACPAQALKVQVIQDS